MADEKTPEELEAERVRLMKELENEDPDLAAQVEEIHQQKEHPKPQPRPAPRKFREIETDFNGPKKIVKKDNTVLILLVLAILAAVVGYFWMNYKNNANKLT